MRILIATWSRNVVGGAEKYLQVLLPALADRGNEVGIIYERPVARDGETIESSGFPVAAWSIADLGLETVLREVGKWKPDVVYVHGLESAQLEDALLGAYPLVLFAHGYYGTCGTGTKSHSFPQVRPCERRFGPACVLLHYPRRCGGLNPLTTWRLFQRQAQRRAGLARYRGIIVASNHMYREFVQQGLAPERVHLIPLPTTDIVPQASPPTAKAPTGKVLMMGRLTDLKGGHYLIEALALAKRKLESISLTIAGDGPERQNLEDLALRCQVPAEFIEWVRTPQKLELIRQADLLAVPSLWPEPFGLVGIEGGCLGLPAVGFAVGGISDWLIPGYAGELAPGDPPTVEGLAEAILRALANPEYYSKLCRGAWEVANRFTLESHLARLEPVLCAQEFKPSSIKGICTVV